MKLHEMNDSKAGSLGDFLPNLLEMGEDEHIIFMSVTDNYSGELLLAFENGKVARIPFEAYATKTNRKKLINAYSGVSPIVDIIHLPVTADVTISSSNDRLITVNSQVIPLKTTKSTQGVQVLKLKKGCVLKYMKRAEGSGLADPEAYRTKVIPAPGNFLKKADQNTVQLSLLDD
jgi:DNA gyrase subunit A